MIEEAGRSQFGAVLYRTTDAVPEAVRPAVARRAARRDRLGPVPRGGGRDPRAPAESRRGALGVPAAAQPAEGREHGCEPSSDGRRPTSACRWHREERRPSIADRLNVSVAPTIIPIRPVTASRRDGGEQLAARARGSRVSAPPTPTATAPAASHSAAFGGGDPAGGRGVRRRAARPGGTRRSAGVSRSAGKSFTRSAPARMHASISVGVKAPGTAAAPRRMRDRDDLGPQHGRQQEARAGVQRGHAPRRRS